MTIAEKLFKSDPKTLFEIIVIYRLEELARLYFPDRLEDNSGAMREEEQQEREITRLKNFSSPAEICSTPQDDEGRRLYGEGRAQARGVNSSAPNHHQVRKLLQEELSQKKMGPSRAKKEYAGSPTPKFAQLAEIFLPHFVTVGKKRRSKLWGKKQKLMK